MINHLKYFICFSILIGIQSGINAQSESYVTNKDLRSWNSIGVGYKVNKQFRVNLSQHLRLKDNISAIDEYFTQMGLKYKLTKKFSIVLAGRYIRENDNQGKIQGYEDHFRWNTDLEYRHSIKRLTLKYRGRYQSKKELNTENPKTTVLRLKIGSEYNIRKWKLDPSFSGELFNGLSNDEGFNKIRFTLGTKYETKKAGDFGLFLRHQKDLVGATRNATSIVGIKYQYNIK